MNKINIDNWREFKISKLFDVKKGTRLTKANMIGGDINFIGASAANNGVTAKIGNTSHLHPSNTITVSYNGSVGETFYQTEKFWASDDVNVLYPRFEMNQHIAFFFIPIIKQLGKQYAFIDKWKKEDMEQTNIFLPATPQGEPDFQYMEDYIKNIEELQNRNLQIIKSLIPPPNENIEIVSWKYFKVSELFEVISGKGVTKQEIYEHPGELPAIQSGEENFGRIGYLDYNYCVSKKYSISKGECLTVARSGSSGFVGYQPQQCVVGDSAKILEPKFEANTKRLLFIRALLMVNKSLFAYTDKVTTSSYENSSFPLPTTPTGEPDFQYMEQTITALITQQQAKLSHITAN